MTQELQKKVDFAIKLLQSAEKKAAEVGQPVEIAYSSGKDSDCLLELAKMAGINYRAIYKITTIDPPGSTKHAKEKGVECRRPKETFLQLIDRKGLPSRQMRFCCAVLKEYKILDYVALGVRKDESNARRARYHEPEVCRVYSKDEKVRQYLPMLDWTAKDVEEFIKSVGIKCHPLYYDEDGNFHVERRLGCVGCPMYKKGMLRDYKQYPKLLKQVMIHAKRWAEARPNSSFWTRFGSVHNLVFFKLFCDNYEEYLYKLQPDIWGGQLNCKEYLENYFNIKLDI